MKMKSDRVERRKTSDQEKQIQNGFILRNRNTNKPTISASLPFTLVAQSKKSNKLMFGISPIKKN